jgi:hypothetical protein
LNSGDVHLVDVTTLLAPGGQPYATASLDPEGLTLTKSGELIVTSEGIANRGIAPWVRRYSLDGTFIGDLRVPAAFNPTSPTHGVRQNLAFEAAAVSPDGRHLFVGMEVRSRRMGRPRRWRAGLCAHLPGRLMSICHVSDPSLSHGARHQLLGEAYSSSPSTRSSCSPWSDRFRWVLQGQETRSSCTRRT